MSRNFREFGQLRTLWFSSFRKVWFEHGHYHSSLDRDYHPDIAEKVIVTAFSIILGGIVVALAAAVGGEIWSKASCPVSRGTYSLSKSAVTHARI